MPDRLRVWRSRSPRSVPTARCSGRSWRLAGAWTLTGGNSWRYPLDWRCRRRTGPEPGQPVYEVRAGEHVALAEQDLAGPLRELVMAVVAEGWGGG